MDVGEYMAFIPLLIYGIGLADLLGQWKRFFSPEERYFPYVLFTIILTEVAVYNIFIYIDLVNQLAGQSYLSYLSFLIPPFLFLMVTNIFTPDQGTNTRTYFDERLSLICSIAAIFVASHFFYDLKGLNYIRVIMILLLILLAVFRKKWLIYVLGGVWLVGFVLRASVVST